MILHENPLVKIESELTVGREHFSFSFPFIKFDKISKKNYCITFNLIIGCMYVFVELK